MTTFLFSYRMPEGYVPGRPDAVGTWMSYFDTLGDHLLDAGNPVFESGSVGRCGPGTTLGGYSMVEAEDLESALVLAQGSPGLGEGGGVEVGVVTFLVGAPE